MTYKNILTMKILDRYDFPNLSNKEWEGVCKEVEGRIDIFLDEKLDQIIEEVCEEVSDNLDTN